MPAIPVSAASPTPKPPHGFKVWLWGVGLPLLLVALAAKQMLARLDE